MCRQCLLEARPDRARFVADSGAFTLNYAGCVGCKGNKQPIVTKNRVVEESEEDDGGDYEEITNFEHACSVCAHVIAEHYHSFRVIRTPVSGSDAAAVGSSEAAAAASSPAASAEAAAAAVRVTHDYLMECVLCGKGADEQVVQSGLSDSASAPGASAGANAAVAAPLPVALSSIQINAMLAGSRAPGQALAAPSAASEAAAAKEAEEWAE